MNGTQLKTFAPTVWQYYDQHKRVLPWRQPDANGHFDPYKILVSEIMLQQTQVSRVIPKYQAFLDQFPTAQRLADASLGEVLRLWGGLGYNRRAKYLWQAAQQLASLKKPPTTQAEWQQLPGVGSNTAGAIMAYAYNQPVVFIETNIRSVFIHHFFPKTTQPVSDAQLKPLLEACLPDNGMVREWYWALMDYGTHLKVTQGNTARRSRHYAAQSRFEGSLRQVRGKVLRQLHTGQHTLTELQAHIADERLDQVLDSLQAEGLIQTDGTQWYLPK